MQKKIAMIEENENFFDEIFELFVVSKTANGVSDATLRNYHYHRKAISKYLDTNRPISEITKRDLERMIVDMKKDGIKHNSIATYVRFLRTIFNWCEAEEIAVPKLKNLKEKEVVKETYTDAELEKLLRKPKKGCDFGEYRTWVIINFLLNSGCRAATARNIKNKDVDLDGMRVVFRHNKNGKIQTIPLCSIMASILKDYMKIRKGKPDDFLFCDVYGGELTENALRHAVANYNKSRGVSSTSVHKFRHMFCLTSKNEKERQFCLSFSHQLSMSLNCLLYPLRLNADVPLSHRRRTVLQESLNKGNIVAVVFVDFRCIPLAEAVSADALIAKVVADNGKLLLYGALCDGENQVFALYPIAQAVVFYVLLYDEGHSENSALAGLLLHNLKPVSVAIPHNVARSELHNVADSDTQVALKHKSRCDSLIGAAAAEAFLHGLDYLFVLRCGQRLCSLVHHALQKQKFVKVCKNVRNFCKFARIFCKLSLLVFVFFSNYAQCRTSIIIFTPSFTPEMKASFSPKEFMLSCLSEICS